jgi:hypothetical protein
LFIKSDEQASKTMPSSETYNFPASPASPVNAIPKAGVSENKIDENVLNEVIEVYEKGIDSINMPGYDFYEFYKAIHSVNLHGEQSYSMAFRMAHSMDSNLTAQKLLTDAEFYISKINEVHSQYTMQGQQKLNGLDAKKNEEKNRLMNEIDHGVAQVNQLRSQLQSLESEINQKRLKLSTVDGEYFPKESAIRQKLLANDSAKQISISKLLTVKDGIQKHIK